VVGQVGAGGMGPVSLTLKHNRAVRPQLRPMNTQVYILVNMYRTTPYLQEVDSENVKLEN
jgi:ABC-type methionine transport system permease subunit